MKEITRVVTLEVTTIHKNIDEADLISRDDSRQYAEILKDALDADDVVVLKIQDFVRGDE